VFVYRYTEHQQVGAGGRALQLFDMLVLALAERAGR
jgi:hypothetical protein